MKIHTLIILGEEGLVFTGTYPSADVAKDALWGWVLGAWDDSDMDPEDYGRNTVIDYYFDSHEEADWRIEGSTVETPSQVDAPAEEDDIILTPGMCAVIYDALGKVMYTGVGSIMAHHGEVNWDGLLTTQVKERQALQRDVGENMVRHLRKQFRQQEK